MPLSEHQRVPQLQLQGRPDLGRRSTVESICGRVSDEDFSKLTDLQQLIASLFRIEQPRTLT